MNCLKQCIHDTKQQAYAHHIQRLMVIDNFALLAGIDPDLVNEWYLIVMDNQTKLKSNQRMKLIPPPV